MMTGHRRPGSPQFRPSTMISPSTEIAHSTVPELAKSQLIRIWDVFAFGPYMIWAGLRLVPSPHREIMVIGGIGVMLFNGRNWLINKGFLLSELELR